VTTSNGKQSSIYRRHEEPYQAHRRKDYWRVCGDKKIRISVNAYAKKYGYSPITVRQMCRSGVVSAIKFKGKWLVLDVPVGR